MDAQADRFYFLRLQDAAQGNRELVIRMVNGPDVVGKVISVSNGVFHMQDMSAYRISAIAGIESELVARR